MQPGLLDLRTQATRTPKASVGPFLFVFLIALAAPSNCCG
jgi:hypothetical protein